jgi:hypothetical protein
VWTAKNVASAVGAVALRVAPGLMFRWQWRQGAGVGEIPEDRWLPPSEVRDVLRMLAPVSAGCGLVRIGGAADGGYLVPDDLVGVEALLSAGVGATWTFERDLGERFGIHASMRDGSIGAPPGLTELQDFDRLYVAAEPGPGAVTLAEWVAAVAADGDLMLQMDIEGAEIDILAAVDPAVLRRFRVVVVEFHRLPWALVDGPQGEVFRTAMRRLDRDFLPVHIHPNNCCGLRVFHGIDVPCVLEVTYLRRDRVPDSPIRIPVGHPEDRDNVPAYPSLGLPAGWPD